MKTNNQFTIALPDGWKDSTVHLFMGPDDSGVQHMLNLVVDNEIGETDLYEYARERIDLAMEAMSGAEILKEEEKTLPNGNVAYECVYKWIPAEGKIIFKKQVFLIINGIGYIFSADFSKKTIKTIGVEVDSIIASLTPLPASTDDD